MPHYEQFIFESYILDPARHTIELHYSLDGELNFTETLTLPDSLSLSKPSRELDAALLAVHLAGGVSYYKAYLPKAIKIRSGKLNPAQAKFWNTLYLNGLGEFFYRNNIDFHGLINFPAELPEPAPRIPHPFPAKPSRTLVPFGGGKDSIVSTELLREAGINQTLFRVRSHPLINELAQTAHVPLLTIERALDPQLADLNAAGALNGHVPITAYISFLSVITALLGGFDAVVFSNEHSSSYGNVEYLGMTINHQWSKSLEFEALIRNYIHDSITERVQYLNPLRPLSELKIAELFTQHPRYFDQATSCNRNWTLAVRKPGATRWCGECPKCAFSFALFAAFLPAVTVKKMFGQNLFSKTDLLPLYRELWGQAGFKPFECVGTPEETQAALYLASQKGEYGDSSVMQAFVADVLPELTNPAQTVTELLKTQPAL